MAAKYEVHNLIVHLAAAYPEFKPDNMAATLAEYEDALGGYPLDMLEHAITSCRNTYDYFPKISQIRKACADLNANKTTYGGEQFDKQPMSPKVREYLDAFRQRMVDSGKWTEGHRVNRFNERKQVSRW